MRFYPVLALPGVGVTQHYDGVLAGIELQSPGLGILELGLSVGLLAKLGRHSFCHHFGDVLIVVEMDGHSVAEDSHGALRDDHVALVDGDPQIIVSFRLVGFDVDRLLAIGGQGEHRTRKERGGHQGDDTQPSSHSAHKSF